MICVESEFGHINVIIGVLLDSILWVKCANFSKEIKINWIK
jgi:hypothetical protein